MKKLLAFLMAAVLLLSCTAAMAEYDKHITINGTNRGQLVAGVDYTEDMFYQWMSETFNIDYEPWITDSATHADTVSLWINTGEMPDIVTMVDFNYNSYREWVDQGLLGALPDDWHEKYPHLAHTVAGSMIEQYLTIDGKIYGLPGTTYLNFVPMEIPVAHTIVYYRLDWAKELGYEFGPTITLSELAKFCVECVEKDLAGNMSTVGLTTRTSAIAPAITDFLDVRVDGFVKTENGYVWGPTVDGVVDQIKVLRELYTSKAIDPDFYLLDSSQVKNRFSAGIAAAMYGDGGPGNRTEAFTGFEEANPDKDADECIATAVLTDDNGVVHTREASNFWTIKYFKPDIDPEVMDRILSMCDYFCDPAEGQITLAKGIPGVDWQWTEDGMIDVSIRDKEKPGYQSTKLVAIWGMCNDELYVKTQPLAQPLAIEYYLRDMATKAAGNVIRLDYDYSYYSSELKSQYSIDINSKIGGIAADVGLDIDAEWANFIKENEGMWKPLQEELNDNLIK